MSDSPTIPSYPDCFFLSNVCQKWVMGQPSFKHASHYKADDVFFDLRINQQPELKVVRRQGVGELFCVFSYPSQHSSDEIKLEYWMLKSIDEEPSKAPFEGGMIDAFPMRGELRPDVNPKLLTREEFDGWKPKYFNSRGNFNQFSLAVPSWIQEEHGGIIYSRKTKR